MFRKKTVIVIGAGASVEVGMPLGSDLLRDVCDRLSAKLPLGSQSGGDPGLLRSLVNWAGSDSEGLQISTAANQICASASQAISIDNVIDALEDELVALVGKTAIVRSILIAESRSKPFNKQGNGAQIDLERFSKTWYSELTKLVCEGVKKSQVETIFDNVQIINFNYDRCLERYLPASLSSYYGIGLSHIEQVCASLVIHRPYGSAGKLDWESRLTRNVPFGDTSEDTLVDIAHEIRTFTEQIEDEVLLDKVRKAVEGAERIIFLGFGFHRQNLELIAPPLIARGPKGFPTIFATTYGLSSNERATIRSELASALSIPHNHIHSHIDLALEACYEFFQNHRRTFAT